MSIDKKYIDSHKINEKRNDKGSVFFELDDGRIVKYIHRSKVNDIRIWEGYLKEAQFYDNFKSCDYSFVPEVYELNVSEDEIIIVMKKYIAIKETDLCDEIVESIIKNLVLLHSIQIPSFLNIVLPTPLKYDDGAKNYCYMGWMDVLSQFENPIDNSELKTVVVLINNLNRKATSPKMSLSHGSFHLENIMQDENGNIVFVDWKWISASHPAGDLSSLIKRLEDVSYPIIRFVEKYSDLSDTFDEKISFEELDDQIRLINLNDSLMFGHEYLHGEDREYVKKIYYRMINDFFELDTRSPYAKVFVEY